MHFNSRLLDITANNTEIVECIAVAYWVPLALLSTWWTHYTGTPGRHGMPCNMAAAETCQAIGLFNVIVTFQVL